MKRLLTAIVLLFAFLCISAGAQTPSAKQYDKLASMKHPRLLATNWEFNEYKKAVARGDNPSLVTLHQRVMETAAKLAASDGHLEYRKDASGRRILHVSREALEKLFVLAYAYRFKPSKAYLTRAEGILDDVCNFPDWNNPHFLDTAEMAAAVAIAYDWMYPALSRRIRALVEARMQEYAIGDEVVKKYLKTENNWNEVCNAGIICGAIALADVCPEVARRRIDESVRSNAKVMEVMYEPDGIYPEGPIYWSYGTSFEILLLKALETAFGTDFGLSNHPGFLSSGRYILFSESGTGKYFNFYDNSERAGLNPESWYFASRTGDLSTIYYEAKKTCSREVLGNAYIDRLMPLFMLYAAKCSTNGVSAPASGILYGQGETPVAIMRNGWDADNSFLAIKAGMGGGHHGHLDAGTFVYDAWGCRWAAEVPVPAYATSEKELAKVSTSVWYYTQDSWRWEISAYNNFHHNTLSVNGKKHNAKGMTTLEQVWQAPGLKCARVDITPALSPDLERAVRTATLLDDGNIEIKDKLTAGKFPAFVRWTLVTPADVKVGEDGITLTQKGVTLLLKAGGAEVSYCTWPSVPDPSTSPVASFDKGTKDTVCGFTLVVPKGKEVTVTTTLTKQN